MTGRGDPAWLADLASTLAEVDEFLRSPAGHAALEDFYRARGSIAPGFEAGSLIDDVSFTALWLGTPRNGAPESLAWPARQQSAHVRGNTCARRQLKMHGFACSGTA